MSSQRTFAAMAWSTKGKVTGRERFLAELRTRQRRWSDVLAPYAGAAFIAYHNSWPYFARRFRLNVIGFIEPKEGIAPSPAQQQALLDRVSGATMGGIRTASR